MVTQWKKWKFLIFKGDIEHLSRKRAFWTILINPAESYESVSVHAMFRGTSFVWTKDDPNKLNNAIVLATIRIEYAKQRNSSHLIHSCMQRNIAFCLVGNFRDSQRWLYI